ncbi:flippase activity-associated protein Agl23, partial [Halobacterium bonnevillei]
GGAVAFLAVVVVFYAPRPEFYAAFGEPTRLPGVLTAGTAGAWAEFWGTWGTAGSVSRDHSYIAFLTDALRTLSAASLMLVVAAVFGFLAERYVADDPRDFVLFAGYWGVASIVVYPAITDISGHWSVVHAVVPLAIPAAVGLRLVVERGWSAFTDDDYVSVALAAIVLLAAAGQMGAVTAETSFLMPQEDDNELVQYGQPASDMQDTLANVERVAAATEGTDVLYYGDHFYAHGEPTGGEAVEPSDVSDTNWFHRLPLPWYTGRADAATDSTLKLTAGTATGENQSPSVEDTDAPVVITRAKHYTDVAGYLEPRGYESWTYELTSSNTVFVIFVDSNASGYKQP